MRRRCRSSLALDRSSLGAARSSDCSPACARSVDDDAQQRRRRMITFKGRGLIVVACALTIVAGWCTDAGAQSPGRGIPNVVDALRAAPGVLGVELAQTRGGRRVIFAWFEGKQALVDWYHSEAHVNAMRTVAPTIAVDPRPLPDLPENSGPILALVSVQPTEGGPRPFSSISVELYGRC